MSEDREYVSDKLFTLKDASDPARMRAVLAPELPHLLGPAVQLASLDVQVLRRRKQRCVLRYRLHGTNEAGAAQTLSLIGKVYKADAGESVTQLMRQLWDAGFDREAPDHIAIPEVAAYMPRLSLLLQEEIGGVPVKEHLDAADRGARPAADGRGARQTAPHPGAPGRSLHPAGPPAPVPPAPAGAARTLPRAARVPSTASCSESARLEKAYNGFAPALIHGDFHMGQVHVGPGTPGSSTSTPPASPIRPPTWATCWCS